MAGAQQKTKTVDLGLPAAKLDENPYGELPKEAAKPAPVPAPSKKQLQEAAYAALRNEMRERHSERGRVLPKDLVQILEKKAVEIYDKSREAAMERVERFEKERGFELTPGQRTKIWKEEYSFAVLREMDAYYRPEAERRFDARVESLKPEDRAALESMRETLVSGLARALALNPAESIKPREIDETLWAMDKLSRALDELYGKDRAWMPESARDELNRMAMEIFAESRENAKREIAHIEKNGGTLSNGQKVHLWEIEYEKSVKGRVMQLSGARG